MKRNNKKGFTIVELVIVIAVIAILSVALIPTFSNVVAKAEMAAAKSDANTVYQQYVADSILAGNEPAENLVYVDGGYYVTINDGVVSEATKGTAPAGTAVTGYSNLYTYTPAP